MTPLAEIQEKRIIRWRISLMLKSPFFSALVLKLKLQACESIPTAATDGVYMFYNPVFIATLDDLEGQFLVAHETMHPALSHHTRMGERELRKWNVACDAPINEGLQKDGYKVIKGAVMMPQFSGMYAEEIYSKLPDQPGEDGGEGQGGGGQEGNSAGVKSPVTQGGFGQVIRPVDPDTGKPLSQEQCQQIETDWKIATKQAEMLAKKAGKMPGHLQRVVDEALRPKVDWREVLRRFIQAATDPVDYTWAKQNKRFVSQGLYLPSVLKEGIGELHVHVDVSGSIGQDLLNQWAAELNQISKEARPEKIKVLYFDHTLQSVVDFSPDDEITLHTQGGGGTSFRPSFAFVEKEGITPVCAVVLTDLCCDEYPEEPPYPVLWATESDSTARWGETVRLEEY